VSGDSDLRERFASLRQEEAARTPGFDPVLQRARRSFSRRYALAAAACLTVVLMASLTLQFSRDRAPRAPHPAAPALADWRAPTDFLLNTPVSGLLHAVPQFGEPLPKEQPLPPDLNGITPTDRTGPEHHS
jgi:hypothetical protein